jgi:hypothetical protein
VTREQLEHLIRAAGSIADDDLVIIGSQALLGAFPEAPSELLTSMEADMYPMNAPDASDVIDGAIGDGSQFHATFGIYAHGVDAETAVAPNGWQARLIRVEAPPVIASRPTRCGWCIEPHDLMLSKLAAGRQRDWDYVEAAIRHGLVRVTLLRERLELMPDSHREPVRPRLDGAIKRAGR